MAGTPFTSTGTGNWNDGGTWGNTSPGVKGTDWPGTAADVVTVAATHVVTYNVSETNAMGLITVNGTLKFSRTMSTLLVVADTKFLLIGATGEVDQGKTGDIIPFPYTSEIRAFEPAADNTTGIKFNANGAKLYAYGDPVTYGETDYAFLAENWVTASDANTFLVTDDFTDDGNPIAIAGLSVAAACVVTWVAHGLVTNDVVKFAGITQADWSGLNGTRAITYIDADSFSVAVDTSGFGTPYDAGTDPGTYTRPKWKVNQELYVHKGTTYSNNLTDINGDQGATDAVFTIASISYSAPNTTININESVTAGQTFYQYGRVVNATRNVIWKKSNAATTIGSTNTNRFAIVGNSITSGTLDIQDIIITGFTGINSFLAPHSTVNVVARNGTSFSNSSYFGTYTNIILPFTASIMTSSRFCNLNVGASFGTSAVLINASSFNTISGNFYSHSNNISGGDAHQNTYTINWFANGSGISRGKFINCRIGYNENNVTMANTSTADIDLRPYADAFFLNCKLPDTAGYTNFQGINAAATLPYNGTAYFEHFNQTLNDHRIVSVYGHSKRVDVANDAGATIPNQRTGGSTDGIQLSGFSNMSATLFFKYEMPPLWFTTGTAKTYRFYVQTDIAADALVTGSFKVYATYLDSTSTISTATGVCSNADVNITTRANQDDWSEYVEVDIPATALTGWVRPYFKLMHTGGTSTKFIWIDPKVVIS